MNRINILLSACLLICMLANTVRSNAFDENCGGSMTARCTREGRCANTTAKNNCDSGLVCCETFPSDGKSCAIDEYYDGTCMPKPFCNSDTYSDHCDSGSICCEGFYFTNYGEDCDAVDAKCVQRELCNVGNDTLPTNTCNGEGICCPNKNLPGAGDACGFYERPGVCRSPGCQPSEVIIPPGKCQSGAECCAPKQSSGHFCFGGTFSDYGYCSKPEHCHKTLKSNDCEFGLDCCYYEKEIVDEGDTCGFYNGNAAVCVPENNCRGEQLSDEDADSICSSGTVCCGGVDGAGMKCGRGGLCQSECESADEDIEGDCLNDLVCCVPSLNMDCSYTNQDGFVQPAKCLLKDDCDCLHKGKYIFDTKVRGCANQFLRCCEMVPKDDQDQTAEKL